MKRLFSVKMKKLFSLFLFSFQQIVFAQQLPFRNLTVEDGLAGSVVNYILQDSRGYIWFATQTGVSRFDGINFKNFTTQNGLSDNTILKIYEDKNSRIWFFAFNGIPSFYQNGKISQLDSAKKFQSTYLTTMLEDDCGNLWLGSLSDGVLKIEKYKITQKKKFNSFFNTVSAILQDSTKRFWFATDSGIYVMMDCSEKAIVFKINAKSDSVFLTKNKNEEYGIFTEKEITDKSEVIAQYKTAFIKDTLVKNSHNLFIGAQQYDLFQSSSTDTFRNFLLKDFRNEILSFYLEDNEKNIWLSTLLGGVYFLPYYAREFNNFSQSSGLSDNNISAVTSSEKGNILLATGTGNYNLISKKSIKILYKKPYNFFSDKINCLLRKSDGNIWSGTDGGIEIIEGEKIVRSIELRNVNALSESKNGTVWTGTLNGIFKINNYKVEEISRQLGIKDLRVEAVFAENDSEVWLGCKDGLWKFDGKKIFKWDEANALLNSEITSLQKSSDGILWITTQNNGLLAMENNMLHQLTTSEGICNNQCKVIFLDEENTVWLGTNKGVSKISITDKSSWKYSIRNWTKKDGLSSGEINDIFKFKNKVYVATAKGLTVFDETKILTSDIPPPIYITKVLINDSDSGFKTQYELPYTKNNLRIDFMSLCFGIADEITYRYKMSGIDTTWKYTQTNFINFPLLPPNRYTFSVSAMNKDGVWSEENATVSFIIHPPFWQTAIFKIAMLILVILILVVLYFYISRLIKIRERKKNELKQRISEAEQKAIRAQMNPHFIFNALNSIQRFIVENDTLSANEYLAKFGKLIRRILDNSKHPVITIADEIETLKLYLDLESLRFENKFQHTMEIDPAIDTQNSRIPPMLIQPYIENAIWHGLMNKSTPGKLIIKMQLKNDFILCTIEDNGVGRQKAMELKSKHKTTHKSSGMQLTQERLEMLNTMRNQKLEIKIIDLTNEKNEPAGTKVEIKIPVDF